MKQFLLTALLAGLYVQTVTAIELPPPPPGFTWQEIPELKAAFLRPNGWFFKREENKETFGERRQQIMASGQAGTSHAVAAMSPQHNISNKSD